MRTISECKSCGAKNRVDTERAKQSIVRCGSCGFALNFDTLPQNKAKPDIHIYSETKTHSATARTTTADPPTACATSAPTYREPAHPTPGATADALKGIRNAYVWTLMASAVVGIFGKFLATEAGHSPSQIHDIQIVILLLRLGWAVLTGVFSSALKNAWWATTIYIVLSLLPLLFLIPPVILLVQYGELAKSRQ
ncbi:MAG: hypothetical protein GX934_15965 [Burkholderiales bacterium]|nr:hypothetical protein [Burkholderiales bacterium]